MRWTAISLPVGVLLAGCGPTHPVALPVPVAATRSQTVADRLAELAGAVIEGDPIPGQVDSVFAPDADVIADGRRRSTAPRFAGIEAGGQVVVGSTRVDVAGGFAWALVEYRWIAPGQDRIREAWATLVFIPAPHGRGWRIAAAHSSEVH